MTGGPPQSTETTAELTAAALTDEQLGQLIPVKIDGKEGAVPLKDLIGGHQKSAAADARFREAHEMKTAYEADATIATDLRDGLASQDPEQVKRAFRNAGMAETDVENLFSRPQGTVGAGNTAQDGSPPGGPASGDSREPDRQAGRRNQQNQQNQGGEADGDEDDMTAIIQHQEQRIALLESQAKKTTAQQKRDAVTAEVDAAIDTDEILGKMIVKLDVGDPEQAKRFRQRVYQSVAEASKTEPWGPRAIQKGLKGFVSEIRAQNAALDGESGTPGPEGDDQNRTPGATPGFGPAGISVSRLHQPLTGTVKPVPVGSDNYEENLGARLLRRLRPGK